MHVQNRFFGDLDVIITSNFYEASQVKDKCIFQQLDIGRNALAPNIWHEYIKCYKLNTIICQSDSIFINILNRF